MIGIQWCLRRCELLEAAILSAAEPDFKALNNISLHASRLKRQYSATFKELNSLQECRYNKRQQNLAQAEVIRRADVIAVRSTDFKEFGFDFTVELIDQRIRRQAQATTAARTVATGIRGRAA